MTIAPGGYQPPYGTSPIPGSSQVVIPQITIPNPQAYSWSPAPNGNYAPAGSDLARIKDLDGAKQFQTAPNSRYALFLEDDDVFYIKETDNNNYPVSLKRYRFYEEAEPSEVPPPEYVTKEEFNQVMDELKQLKEEIANGKQSVRTTTSSSSKRVSTTNDD